MKREEFKNRFYSLRKERGMSQEAFANFLGISRPTVGFYENADKETGRIPDAEMISLICSKCEVSADWLLGLSDTRTVDVDTRGVCRITGLSEKAVDNLIGTTMYGPEKAMRALTYVLENEQMWEFLAGKTEAIEGNNLLANIGSYFICADSDTFFVHSPGSRGKEVCGYDTLAIPKENAFMNIGTLVDRVKLDSVLETLRKMKTEADTYWRASNNGEHTED